MKKNRILSALLALSMCFSLVASAANIGGSPAQWAKSEIDEAISLGIVPQLTGNPQYSDNITRLQFAQLVVQMVEVNSSPLATLSEPLYTDCDDVSVNKAGAALIVTGAGDNTFNPAGELTREQLAAMLYRGILVKSGIKDAEMPIAQSDLTKWADGSLVSPWAAINFSALIGMDILKGSDGMLMPQGSCTVEQAILLTLRAYKQVEQAKKIDVTKEYAEVSGITDLGQSLGLTLANVTKPEGYSSTYCYTYMHNLSGVEATILWYNMRNYMENLGYRKQFIIDKTHEIYRHATNLNKFVQIEFYSDAIRIYASNDYKSAKYPGTLKYLDEKNRIPDFGAMFNCTGDKDDSVAGSTVYVYKLAQDADPMAFIHSLFENGYYCKSVTKEGSFYIMSNDDTDIDVAIEATQQGGESFIMIGLFSKNLN